MEDALPLIHHYTSLSPMMEVALELSAAAAKERGLEVVGLYVVPRNDQTGLGRVGERVLGEMKVKFDGSFALVVSALSIASPACISQPLPVDPPY